MLKFYKCFHHKEKLVFKIFHNVLDCRAHYIRSYTEDIYGIYFKTDFENPYTNFLKIIISPYQNLTFEYVDSINNRGIIPTIEDIDQKITNLETEILDKIANPEKISDNFLKLFCSWIMAKLSRMVFDFSKMIWFSDKGRELFGKRMKNYSIFELLSNFTDGISRIWFYLLFEELYTILENWIDNITNLELINIEFNDSDKTNIFNILVSSKLYFGVPILICENDLFIMRKFSFDEIKTIDGFFGAIPKWFRILEDKVKKYGYNFYQINYSTLKEFVNNQDIYPRYHCLPFSRSPF